MTEKKEEKKMRDGGAGESPYRLRDHSKRPSRYRDYLEDDGIKETKTSALKSRKLVSFIRFVTRTKQAGEMSSLPKRVRTISSNGTSPGSVLQMDDDVSSNDSVPSRERAALKAESRSISVQPHTSTQDTFSCRSTDPSSIQAPRRFGGRSRPGQADLSHTIKDNLRRLKNVLKLPKARRWVYCEFFYSEVDQQLFLGDNEFSQLLRESFPNLQCRNLRRPEWRAIRRLIGKPRRCSQAFLNEERQALEAKRAKVRQIYEGTVLNLSSDSLDLPLRLPRPLVVGAKIYARVRQPKDGIYAGTIDAVLPDSYRVVFDKEEMIPPQIIKDSEVMSEQKVELLSLAYFLEQNRASMPSSLMKLGSNAQQLTPRFSDSRFRNDLSSYSKLGIPKRIPMNGLHFLEDCVFYLFELSCFKRLFILVRDEKVGNFPVRMLVILVKLAKLIELKKGFVKQLGDLNGEAEKMNLLSNSYPTAFQRKYAQLVIDLETLNKQMQAYLNGVNEYITQLLPQLSEVTVTARPEALRKLCHTHALQIVKHCNNGLNVKTKRALDLITSLIALLLQVRSLGQQRCTPYDLHTLSESLSEIRKLIRPSNAAAFQDYVEVHMKQIHNMMLNSGAV
uniref:DIRP domain-containing protein n=1 Tax=Syphacia muris TaxID=451379 RepID=A0A0N5A8E7_9BILA